LRAPTKAEWASAGRWVRDHAPAFTVSFVTFSALWAAVVVACLTLYVWDSKFYSSLAPPGMEASFMAAGIVFRTFVIFGGLAIVWMKTNKLNPAAGRTLRFIWVMGLIACGVAALGFVTEGNDYHYRKGAAITQTESASTESADTIIARAEKEKVAIRADRDQLVAAARTSMNLVLDDGNSKNDDVSSYEKNIALYQTEAQAKLDEQDAKIAAAETDRLGARQQATEAAIGDPALPAVFQAPARYFPGFDGVTFRDMFALFWVILLEACGSVGAQALLAVQMGMSKRREAQENGAKGGRTTSRRRLIEDMRKARTETKADLSEDKDDGNRDTPSKAAE